ncbi:MAG: isoleucine--tRNA ligase [Alphaproteobacteria bacterium]|nr:isoleucine--tRNA ligase [Alphaproteobacteria bacterium]MDD9919884.1 isoleucine--tRNA ligase [Alphaproteobacteria bacterium]
MAKEKNPYSDTLNLPQTDFPMRAGLPVNEPKWVHRWLDEDIYGKIRAKRMAEGAEKFILHLGPPYANGHMHMGHALTYVLKDFIVRSKFMAGYDSPYVPGWDCHGLPVEWKVEEGIRKEGKTKYDYSTKEIRDRCRAYANKWIDVQKGEWQRFGALGDWDRPYKTMDYANEAGIVRELGKMVARGLVYKGLRSTMWSTVEETALAEAEVEYKDKESTCIYVKFAIEGKENEYIVIWTTTPWTMPSNRAIAYAADETYVALKVEGSTDESLAKVGDTLWVAAKLQEELIRTCGITEFATVGTQQGTDFDGWVTKHPFYERESKLLEGFHVTTDSGTGFVHIAPAHGQEDFQIGREQGLELHCPVLGNGVYDETVEIFGGQHIWKAQEKIVDLMRENGSLLHTYKYTHSYPVSWRSKSPLIFRATPQWFIALDEKTEALNGKTLREKTLEAIYGGGDLKKVNWVPEYGENRIGSMIKSRPDWCISRQRAWGVPITVFLNRKTDSIIDDPKVFEHIAKLIEQEGIDAWDSRIEAGKVEELFPAGWLAENNVNVDDLDPQRDIMDVWIDSGTTHAHVLRADSGEGQRFHRTDGKRPADLYQEGSDQHRGWFHSSILTSVACYDDAPYEEVVTSGFVVDGEGRKFSKSLGNGVEPRELLDTYGMDIIRLWVASSDYSEDIRYSDEIMKGASDAYRRFRNTFRFLLGNLHGFSAEKAMDVTNMPELEQYMLHRLHKVLTEVRTAYDTYKIHHAYRALYDFCNTELSNFYFDVRKDVLYCDAKEGDRRLACQTVLWHLLQSLTTYLAPIIPFTTDETYRQWFGENESVHMQTFHGPEANWQKDAAFEEQWNNVLNTRDAVNQKIESLRAEGEVGANTDVAVTLPLNGLTAEQWVEVLVVSQIAEGEGVTVAKASGHKCPRCWMYHETLAESGVCTRCDEALKTDGHTTKAA